MIIDREAIWAAFWAKVITAIHPITLQPAFVTTDRTLRAPTDVPIENQPALFMDQNEEIPHQHKGLPPKWHLYAELYIYDNWGDDASSIPDQRLNWLISAVDTVLAPDQSGRQTLGGTVSHCWIGGTGGGKMNQIQRFKGYSGMSTQSIAIIPIEIHVPDASGPI